MRGLKQRINSRSASSKSFSQQTRKDERESSKNLVEAAMEGDFIEHAL